MNFLEIKNRSTIKILRLKSMPKNDLKSGIGIQVMDFLVMGPINAEESDL
jgi:hypothetical protein